jgi:acyl-CoA synthetase (AMP-forming)/AMP-acid ligase II
MPETRAAVRDAFAACPDPEAAQAPDAPNPWHALLYERLRDRALPAVISDGTITPAASLWTGSRLWCLTFRKHGLKPGDRLVLAVRPSAEFLQILVAALWERCSVVLVPPGDDVEAVADALDARAIVGPRPYAGGWTPDGCAGPLVTPDALRETRHPATPDVRFLLRTSGTTRHARWIALSDRNVLSVLDSHYAHLRLRNARVISVLPWSHAFGLVLDLLPALLSETEIIRDPNGGRDPRSILRLSQAWGSSHVSAVPLTVQRLAAYASGRQFLRELQGGIVGGAPVAAPLAEMLGTTSLMAGYGQTEAAPGIALGPPGEWTPNYLGRPLGCEVRTDDDGQLYFRGPNACVGTWTPDGGLHRADPGRWVATGDRVRQDGDDLYFEGRTDESFKLANGRFVRAGRWEAALKDAVPLLHDALLHTPDGEHLHLAVTMQPGADAPDEGVLRSALGPLSDRLDRIVVVPPGQWPTSPKGAVDRQALRRHLQQSEPEGATGPTGRTLRGDGASPSHSDTPAP